MADCNVILECCTGQTGCNEKVTIGYLKRFIMSGSTYLIKTTAGTDVHVNSSKPDSYVPTYSELTSGTILPMYSDGGNNRGASNVDGITVDGSYSNKDTVNQTDLTLTYTRFKSLSISAGKTTFNKCGDSTTMSYTYTLTKTIKGISVCDPLTYSYTSSDVSDTSNTSPNKITFAASCNWITVSGTSIRAGQNGTGHSSTRTCNISGSLTYKGTNHSAGNTVTISQAPVGGSWIYSSTTYNGVTATTSNVTEYDCNGGSFSIRGTGKYTDHYYWRDDCGNNYTSTTSAVTKTESAGTKSGSFPKCPEAHNQSKTLSISYHQYSDSITFRQECTCESCDDFTTYGSGNGTATVDECGGNVTVYASVSATIHHKGWVDGNCVETGTTPTSYTQSVVVNVPENTEQGGEGCTKPHTGSKTTAEGGTINYTITQSCKNPCGGCTGETVTYSWNDKSVSLENACASSSTVTLTGTKTTRYTNCADVVTSVTTSVTFTFDTNETSQEKSFTRSFENATITFYQPAGPCHGCTGATTSITWNNVSTTADACQTKSTVNLIGTKKTTYGNCPDETVSTSVTTSFTYSVNNENRTIARTFYYPDNSTPGHATITINQDGPCECLNPTVSVNWNNVTVSAGKCESAKTVTISGVSTTSYTNCESDTAATSVTMTYTFSKNNTTVPVPHIFYYPEGKPAGYATIMINQEAGPCSCENPTVSVNWNNVTVSAGKCESAKTVTISGVSTTSYTNCSSDTAATAVTMTYTFYKNNTPSAVSHTFYYPTNKPTGYATIRINQEAGPCECLNPTVSVNWSDVTLNVGECETSKVVTISGVSTTSYTNCSSDTAATAVTMTYTFSKNNTSSAVQHTFYYPDNKPTGYATIRINQDAGPCPCHNESTSYSYGDITLSRLADKCGENVIVSIPYSATTTYSDCPTETSYGNTQVTYNIPANQTSNQKTHTFYYPTNKPAGYATIMINQEAGPCSCENPTVSVNWNNVTVSAGKCESAKTVTISGVSTTSYTNCESDTAATSVTMTYTFSKNYTSSAVQHTFYYPTNKPTGYATIRINQEAGPCPCSDENITYSYGNVTIGRLLDKCGETATVDVPYTATTTYSDCPTETKYGTAQTTIMVGENQTNSQVPYTFYYPTNKPSGYATITATQAAGPCHCTPSTTYVYGIANANALCSETNKTVSLPYTSTTINSDCTTTSLSSTIPVTVEFTVNQGTSPITRTFYYPDYKPSGYGTITISQGIGCTPVYCECGSLTLSNESVTWPYSETTNYDITISSASCTTGITVTQPTNSHFTATLGSGKVTVRPTATTTTQVVATFTVSYTAVTSNGNVPCSRTVTLTHLEKPDPCASKTCSSGELTVTGVTSPFNYSAHTNEVVGSYSKSQCVASVSAKSDSSWLTVTADSSVNKVKGTMAKQDCGTSQRTANVTVSYTLTNGTTCSASSWVVTQNGDSTPCPNPCVCSNFSASTYSLSFNANGSLSGSPTWRKTTECDDTFTLSGDSNVVGTPTLTSNGFNISVNPNTSTTNTYSGQIKVMLGSTTCTTINYTVAKRACVCSDLSEPVSATTHVSSGGAQNFVVWKVNKDACAGKFEATTSASTCDPIFTSVGSGDSGSYYVISATASPNTSESAKTCVIGYKYYITGSSTACKSFSGVTVTVDGTGACNCSTSNFAMSATAGDIPASGGTSVQVGTYTAKCTNGLDIYSYSTRINSVSFNNGNIYANVKANSSTARTEAITFYGKYSTDIAYCKTFVKYQSGVTCDCSGGGLHINGVSTNMPASGATHIKVGTYTVSAACENKVNIWSTYNGVTNINLSSGNIYADIAPAVIATGAYAQIDFYGNLSTTSDTSCEHFFILQNPCECSTGYTVSPTSLSFSETGGTQYLTVDRKCGRLVANVTSGSSWITAAVSGSRVSVTASQNAYDGRSGTVQTAIVTTNQYGQEFNNCVSSITISQVAGCTCENNPGTGYSQTWAYNESGVLKEKQIAKIGDCCTLSMPTSANFTFRTETSGGYAIAYAYPKTSNTGTSDFSETVAITAHCGSDTCPIRPSIRQECRQDTCSCGNNTISGASRTWTAEEGGINYKKDVFRVASCCTITVSSDVVQFRVGTASTPSNSSVSDGYNYVYCYMLNKNTSTTTDRIGNVTVTATCGSDTCTSTTGVTQTKSAVTCVCSSFFIGTSSTTVNTGATSQISYSSDCSTITSITSDNASVATANSDSNYIYITGVGAGSTTIHVKYNAGTSSCTKDISVTVCSCDSFKLATSSTTVSVGGVSQIAYTAGCASSITSITTNSTAITTANSDSNYIYITGVGAGSTIIHVKYSVNGKSCTKDINVTVTCPTMTITPNNSSGSCNGGTVNFTVS